MAESVKIVAVATFIIIVVVLPEVRDVFDEQHDQDVIILFAGIDGAEESVAGFPENGVDLVLVDTLGH